MEPLDARQVPIYVVIVTGEIHNMRQFETVFPRGRKIRFMVRGVCQFDVLNPCWDNRPTDIPGRHWSGESAACEACTQAAKETA